MPTTLERSKDLQDAAANLQDAAGDGNMTLTGAGLNVEIRGSRAILSEMANLAKGDDDPGTDPWPVDGEGEAAEYVHAERAEEIGAGLVREMNRIGHLARYRIHYLFRRKESWTSKGKIVHGEMKRPTGLLKNYAEADFIMLLNWNSWLSFNAMQRVALIYHELRHGDPDGKLNPHDFEGFFDELQLFGTGTYRDWNSLARAAEKGAEVRHQYTLSLLDEVHH